MAIPSLNITNLKDLAGTEEGKMKLAEELKGIIENVQRRTISSIFKNTLLSGDPNAGTLVARRYASAKTKAYGTARTNSKADPGRAHTVTVNIDIDKEIFEEYEEKDVSLNGIPGLLADRRTAISDAMVRELDENFFLVAVGKRKDSSGTIQTISNGGTEVVTSGATVKDRLSALVLKLHTTKNDFVDGVEKNDIHVVLDAEAYEEMRDYIDTKGNANVQTDIEEFGKFHGVWVYSNNHQPEGIEMIAMCKGSIAEPTKRSEYRAIKDQWSDAYIVGMPFYYGCEPVMPDLIYYVKKNSSGTLGTLTVTSAAGTNSGDTKLTITPAKASGNSYKYKVADSATAVTYGQNVQTWTAWDGTADITAQTGKVVTVVECDSAYKALKAGNATVTAKA